MSAVSLLSKGAMKLFHGAKKNFDSFEPEFASETAFGKGFSFTPEQDIAEGYANITPAKLRKLYGKQYVEEAIERKRGGTPILYEVEANVKDSEVLVTRKNFNEQNKEVQEKLKKLIDAEGLNLEKLDLNKPKFWRQILNLTNQDADKLFTKYGIKAALKDARDSKLKQVGGKIEYTVYDPKVIKIKNKKVLERAKKNRGSEMKVPKLKYAVGSVAQAAAEGADSLLSEARKDVVAARSPERTTPVEMEEMADAVSKVKPETETQESVVAVENLKDTTKLVNSFDFQGGNKKMDKQFIMESLSEVADSPIVDSKETIAEFITDLHRVQLEQESKPLLSPKDFKKLTKFASMEERVEKKEGGEISDADKYISLYKAMEESMDKAETDKDKQRIMGRWQEVERGFEGSTISEALQKMDAENEDRDGKFLGGAIEKVLDGGLLGAVASKMASAKEAVSTSDPLGQEPEASISNLEGPDPIEPSNNAPITNTGYAEGGSLMAPDMPVDTYDNIPPEEMAAVEASQLPDDEMEDEYAGFVLDEALSIEDQEYLLNALEGDERLGDIFDKVMDIAGEFAGDGAVEGPGTGTSDSIPARLSDGEFVFTKKATDQIGTEQLQTMMDDAERAYDGGLMQKYMGGSILSGMQDEMTDPDKAVHDQMLAANAMPSVRKNR